jgi:hypothetical protein
MTNTPVDEMTVRLALIRACNEAGSQRAFARANGIREPHVSAVAQGCASPSDKLAAVLGFAKVTRYIRKPGITPRDEAPGDGDSLHNPAGLVP